MKTFKIFIKIKLQNNHIGLFYTKLDSLKFCFSNIQQQWVFDKEMVQIFPVNELSTENKIDR